MTAPQKQKSLWPSAVFLAVAVSSAAMIWHGREVRIWTDLEHRMGFTDGAHHWGEHLSTTREDNAERFISRMLASGVFGPAAGMRLETEEYLRAYSAGVRCVDTFVRGGGRPRVAASNCSELTSLRQRFM